MDGKKRNEYSNAEPAETLDDPHHIEGPRLKKQKKNTDNVEIRPQSKQPLSKREKRSLKRNEKIPEQKRKKRRRRPTKGKKGPIQDGVHQLPFRDEEELNAMMFVLDFSKEAVPRHFEKGPKILYLKHAKVEDTHFRDLIEGLKELEEHNIGPSHPNHPSRYKRKYSGWQADELRRSSCLDMVGCLPSSLQNVAIHPIFRPSNIDRCPQHVYNSFEASLRLASQFLTHPACARYWITLFFGRHCPDQVLSQKMGINVWRLPQLEECSPEAASLALTYLDQMADYVSFDFRSDMNIGDRDQVYGYARCESKMHKSTHRYLSTEETDAAYEWENLHGRCAVDDTFDPMTIHTRLHLSMDYYLYAKHIGKLTYADEAVRLRFNLFSSGHLVSRDRSCGGVQATVT
jgi:hypothetical protein